MAARTRQPAKPSSRRAGGTEARKALEESVRRVNRSIDAAEVAVKDLRSGFAKGSRDLVQDLERTILHAGTNARRVGGAVSRDVERAMRLMADGNGARNRRSARRS